MKREDYYRSNDTQGENYSDPNRSSYNNYNNYGPQPQQPYYPPRHHHIFMWVIVIILCLGLGWFAADHFMGGDSQSSEPTTVNRSTTVNKTTNNKQPQQNPQQPKINKLEREMNDLNVSNKDQQKALNFFESRNIKDQNKMIKMIDTINKVVPSNTLKKQALHWVIK